MNLNKEPQIRPSPNFKRLVKEAQVNYCRALGKRKVSLREVTDIWARNPRIAKMLVTPQLKIIRRKK